MSSNVYITFALSISLVPKSCSQALSLIKGIVYPQVYRNRFVIGEPQQGHAATKSFVTLYTFIDGFG